MCALSVLQSSGCCYVTDTVLIAQTCAEGIALGLAQTLHYEATKHISRIVIVPIRPRRGALGALPSRIVLACATCGRRICLV